MAVEDEDKTAFRTDIGIFCYTKMPFGLKNAGATYQRLTDKAARQIGRNLEVYVDDLVIKSNEEEVMLKDIEETLERLRSINMKLNPVKCSFGVEEGKFLGVMVTKDGFIPNPDKVLAIARMPFPSSLKEFQTLNGRLVAINKFLANHAAKAPPSTATLKNCLKKSQLWRNPNPIPVRIRKGSGRRATGRKKGGANSRLLRQQSLNWPRDTLLNTGKASTCASTRIPEIEQILPGTPVTVLTNHKLQNVLRNPELSGRLAQWAIELGAHQLTYRPKPAIKGQVVADFVSEIPKEKATECVREEEEQQVQGVKETWSLFTDGALSEEGCGAGMRLLSPEGNEFTYAIRLEFKSTNNEAKYEALLAGLRIAKKMGAKHIEAWVDSLLVYGQFDSCTVIHIKRSENKQADALSKLASTGFSHLAKEVRVEVLNTPSVLLKQVNVVQTGARSWMTPILNYLNIGILPEERPQARKLQHKALQYQLQDGVLYHRSYLGPLLQCVDAEDSNYLIREIHKGICGMHAGPRMIVAKIMNVGYYWPRMYMDVVKELHKCNACKRHAPHTIRPKNNLVPVTTAWPFQKWAIDIVGPFPEAPWRGNGQVERANRSLAEGIKARLDQWGHSWVDELPHVLWAHRTSPKTSNRETPFSLTYGSKAVTPAEIGVPSARVLVARKNDNSQEIHINLDLLDERREGAALQEARYNKKLAKYYNAWVKIYKFNIDDYVLRDNEASRAEHPGKLSPNWEGPYQIAAVLGKDAYE
ncbi:hypothetical protein L1987_53220 [Smallanthus sonchifolius]|uniref:Uncharacterized protein n=1 Tax=Smallanthus sonchifolius TaxID=185202 RepID=A0ACB9EV02_9ASTR|nr:hypothetical protein L1987_53220 [Smallanthus sonchifolius]